MKKKWLENEYIKIFDIHYDVLFTFIDSRTSFSIFTFINYLQKVDQ